MDKVDKISLAKGYTGIFLLSLVFLMDENVLNCAVYFETIMWYPLAIFFIMYITVFIFAQEKNFIKKINSVRKRFKKIGRLIRI